MTVAVPPVEHRARRVGRRGVLALAAVVVVVATYVTTGIGLVKVTSGSMIPTYDVGDRFVTTSVGASSPDRGDVVVFRAPTSWTEGAAQLGADEEQVGLMVKRVVAVAGDRLECCSGAGALVLNGEPLHESYLLDDPETANSPTFRVVVPPGTVWVMGDNRALSFDSRGMNARDSGGFLPVSTITGRVLLPLP